tara:strand:- start:379 stop:2097 length:1719 start_codon:yes stop_codon:yes gene_type:complete
MYEPVWTDPLGTGSADTFSVGAQIQLDRDVTLTAGNSYEIAIRSSFERDVNLATDQQEVLSLGYNEVPDSGSVVKGARGWMDYSIPAKMYPRTGDVYSFGKTGSATHDFVVTEIKTDPIKMVRKIKCIEYHEDIYNDTTFAGFSPDDPGVPGGGTGVGTGTATGTGYGGVGTQGLVVGGPGNQGIQVSANAAPYRNNDGNFVPSISISWWHDQKLPRMPWSKVRLFLARAVNELGEEKTWQYLATIPGGVSQYRCDEQWLLAGVTYEVLIQPVAEDGTSPVLDRCRTTNVTIGILATLPVAPTVVASTSGFKQIYDVTPNNSSEVNAIEGRVGGWIISTPAWVINQSKRRFVSEALLPIPTNAAGQTQASIYARTRLGSGNYGRATILLGTAAFVDVKSSRQRVAEDDYTVAVAVPTDLEVIAGTTDILQWNATTPSTSLGPIYYELNELDAGSPRRSVFNAVIEGYQIRHETLGDLKFSLGSDRGMDWSLEGPMKDDGGNAKVEIEWRWSSTNSTSAAAWRAFEPGEVYAASAQFRLKWTRKNVGDQVKLTRFTVICNDVPATTMVDGGTF